MKKLITILVMISLAILACQDDDVSFGDFNAPTNLEVSFEVANDRSGNVTVTPIAEGAINIHVVFTQNNRVVVNSGETASFRYTRAGQYEQPVTIIAYGNGGASSSRSITLTLDVEATIPDELLFILAGNPDQAGASSKRWVWNRNVAGHFGVGPVDGDGPTFFSAAANNFADGCVYDDVLQFSYDAERNLIYDMIPDNDPNDDTFDTDTFVNWAEINRFFPDATVVQFQDECRDISTFVSLNTTFSVIEGDNGNNILTVDNSFMGYWAGVQEFEILEASENLLAVRGIQNPFNGGDPLMWYFTFVPEGFDPNQGGGVTFDTLVWSDEFDTNGAPDPAIWNYDIGTGQNGWGNQELQFYTDRSENVIVEDGLLKITALRENFGGQEFTSARLTTKDKQEFQYGRLEARIKLPSGGGTWPAFWMLGNDFDEVGWPAAGELDILEHVGNNQNFIQSAIHYPEFFAGNAIVGGTSVDGVSDEFNIYAVEWTADQINFFVNDIQLLTFDNNPGVPFNKDFFILVNIAMGGTLGGNVDPSFTESTMEIDYIRLYQ